MRNFATFKTQSKNHYFFDRNNQIHFCHPILSWIIENPQKNARIDGNQVQLDGLGNFPIATFSHYRRKYEIFKSKGYFKPSIDTANLEKLSSKMQAIDVERTIANMRQITFEVTDFCNIDCEYCFYASLYTDYDERKGKKLDFTLAKNMFDYLVPLWNSHLNTSKSKAIYVSFYGGEPLSNILVIKKIVEYAKTLNLKKNHLVFTMTTNAVMLTKHIDFLAENKFHLLISLDGDKENNQYRMLRNGKNSYDLVVKNIDLLKEKHPEYFDKLVNFNAVLHNKNSVADIHAYFKERYNKTPSIGELNTTGISADYQERFLEMYSSSFDSIKAAQNRKEIEDEMFLELPSIRSVSDFIFAKSNSIYVNYDDLIYPKEKRGPRLPTGTCAPFSKKMFITVNGKILPCESVGQQNFIGMVNRKEVKIDYQDIADKYNAAYDRIRARCSACNRNDSCTQCFVTNHGLEFTGTPTCASFQGDEELKNELGIYMSFLELKPDMYNEIMNNVLAV